MVFLGGPVSVMLVCSLTDHISAASKIPSNIEGGVRIVLLGGAPPGLVKGWTSLRSLVDRLPPDETNSFFTPTSGATVGSNVREEACLPIKMIYLFDCYILRSNGYNQCVFFKIINTHIIGMCFNKT